MTDEDDGFGHAMAIAMVKVFTFLIVEENLRVRRALWDLGTAVEQAVAHESFQRIFEHGIKSGLMYDGPTWGAQMSHAKYVVSHALIGTTLESGPARTTAGH